MLIMRHCSLEYCRFSVIANENTTCFLKSGIGTQIVTECCTQYVLSVWCERKEEPGNLPVIVLYFPDPAPRKSKNVFYPIYRIHGVIIYYLLVYQYDVGRLSPLLSLSSLFCCACLALGSKNCNKKHRASIDCSWS